MALVLQFVPLAMTVRIVERRAFLGPNRHALYPLVHLVVEAHGVEPGEPARKLAAWSLALQGLLGDGPTRSAVRLTAAPSRREVIVEHGHPAIGLAAVEAAVTLVRQILFDAPGEPREVVARFLAAVAPHRLGPSTSAIARAARARGIPVARIDDASLVRLGTGARQKRVRATITADTSAIGCDLARDKALCNGLLAEAGLPVPRQRSVRDPDEARAAAEEIGWPVVVKPLDANHGRGVSIGLRQEAALRAAFEQAAAISATVLVEEQVRGHDHRLLVVGGRLVAAALRMPGHVVGDGRHGVAELVEIANRDPRRGVGHEAVLTRLELDEEARRLMDEAGVTADTVLPAGRRLALRLAANMSKGATATDVTDQVHPDNRWMAERAASVVGLDVAGVDFLTSDIARSFREIGGAICEINAAPGLRMHLSPTVGRARPVAEAIIDALFPAGARATVPVSVVTGTNGKTTTARMVAHIHRVAGRRVGLCTTDGVYVDGRLTVPGDMTGPVATTTVLEDPTVEHAVLELARGGMLRSGLAIDECDVGAILNVTSDHLGFGGIETLDEMAELKGVVGRIARDTVVLNADDPRTVALAPRCTRARRLAWVTGQPDNPLVRWHVRHGGLGAILERAPRGATITLYDDGAVHPLVRADDLPLALGGIARHNVENAMFAAVVAHAGGAPLSAILEGLRSFEPSYEAAPGRLNLHRAHGVDMLLDYGHNPAGFAALAEVARRMPVTGRRICVVGYPGNRRDEDIRESARTLAPAFDLFVCRGEDDPRGRAADEVPRLFHRTFLEEGVAQDRLCLVIDEAESVDVALGMAHPGDLIVFFAADVERTWSQLLGYRPEGRLAVGLGGA